MDSSNNNLWYVNGKYFSTMQAAMDHIATTTKGSRSIESISADRIAILQRSVTNGERGGGLIVPEDFEGGVVFDFGGFIYEFDDSLDHFFDIKGGDEIYITNGTTVIYNEASHVPFAVAVNTETVTIDAHLIDDRRWDPENDVSDSLLFDVQEKGSLVVSGIKSDSAVLTGVVSVVTDGNTGGKIQIKDSRLKIENILTRYKDENGEINDVIPEDISISEDAKTEITISSGYVTINRFETLSDYYRKEEGDLTATLFSKAKINIFSENIQENTIIENPHDTEEIKIDSAIQTIINNTNQNTDVDHEIVHEFDSDHEHPAKDPTCTEEGNTYYHECTICGKFFDANGNIIENLDSTIIPALGHLLSHHEQVNQTCTEEGNIEYWYCTRCGKYFVDEDATIEITQQQTILSSLDHNWGPWIQDDAETHTRTCLRCGDKETEHHHFSEWTETEDGYERSCIDCGWIETKPHEHVHESELVPAIAPTCTEAGNTKYWYCTICKKYFSDEHSEHEISLSDTVLSPLGHSLVSVPAVEPTCEETGNIEYWVCSRCGEYFEDQDGTSALSDEDLSKTVEEGGVLIPATGHSPINPTQDDYVYDENHHWVECEHDHSHILFYAEHTWDEGQYIDNGQHFIRTCTVCGAKYSLSQEEYKTYNIGIGTLVIPTGIINSPSGDMVITREGNVCTVSYAPYLNSATDYQITCRYRYNGKWSDYLESKSAEYGNFTVNLIGILPYTIEMQVTNAGGTIIREQTVTK